MMPSVLRKRINWISGNEIQGECGKLLLNLATWSHQCHGAEARPQSLVSEWVVTK